MQSGYYTTKSIRPTAILVALVVALLLFFGATARRAALVTFAQTEATFAQFISAGGSFEDLCRDGEFPHPGSASCDACRLPDLTLVPQNVCAAMPRPVAFIQTVFRPPTTLFVRSFRGLPAPARGPPLFA